MLSRFQLYLAGYLLTLTYAKTSQASQMITIIRKSGFVHMSFILVEGLLPDFTLSIAAPVLSVVGSLNPCRYASC